MERDPNRHAAEDSNGAGPSDVPILATRWTSPPKTAVSRWFCSGGRLDEENAQQRTHPWYFVLWLTGVDYFSTLGYQPGIALIAAGALSPLATLLLIVVTLFGALPIYRQVARRSYVGQGSIAMLENLLPGWSAKIFVLVLLGFAVTDFVITMTLSAADAAQHAVENPYLHSFLGEARLPLTLGLLLLLALVFLRGFSEAIGLATLVTVPYLILNVVVLTRAVVEILRHPGLISHWRMDLTAHGDWTTLLLASALIFPRLALGMSGFETGVSVMPLVSGNPEDPRKGVPAGRVRATQRLLFTAALIMSFLLMLSSSVTTLLIPEAAYRIGGPASGRAIAWLAHRLLGNGFGTIYDVSTIVILWFAGASAMAGLLNLIPRYLPRFGMAPRWAAFSRPLVVVFFAINVVVTLAFKADVEAQGGAYATGVLALMLSAAVAVALALWREANPKRWLSGYFWGVSAVFAYTFIENVIKRPDGVIIASIFITAILVSGFISRHFRATELRVSDFRFADDGSAQLWPLLVNKKVHLLPIHRLDPDYRARKAQEIKKYYQISGPIAFVHVHLVDNRSEFLSGLRVRVSPEAGGNYLIDVSRSVSIAVPIAYISELIDPISIFIALTRKNLTTQALRYLLWGEGETGLMVYSILLRYWDWTPEGDVRPLIFLMSD